MQRKVANETRRDGAAGSAARLWAPLARFITWESNLGERAEARGPAAHFAYEFIRFGVKQAWACLFGALMLALLVATFLFYPKGAALARYEVSRRERTARVQIGSRGNQWLKEGGNADWVYEYDAWQVPLAA